MTGFKRRVYQTPNLSPDLILPSDFTVEHADIFEPETFEEYIGQEQIKDIVQIIVQAANNEKRPIPSMLISGTYGQGKTTLAKLILQDVSYYETSGTAVNNNSKLMGYVLIDEIHNLRPDICDLLNPLIDSGRLSIIGCTTNPGLLPGPFRSRFRILSLAPYTVDDLTEMQYNAINRKGTITAQHILLTKISERSRNTPRKALQYLSFVMDLMSVRGEGVLTEQTLEDAFEKLSVDNLGLTDIDHKYLEALPEDRPVGLQYLTAVLGVDKDTIEQEIEPYLLQMRLIDRNNRGRYKIAALEAELIASLDEVFQQ